MLEQILLIAFIQGITEFLPVSSSGHLALLHSLSARPVEQALAMDVAVHLGTLVAVIAYNITDIRKIIVSFFSFGILQREYIGVSVALLLATIPVLIAGYYLNDNAAFLEILRSVEVIAWATIGFGILLGIADRSAGRRRFLTVNLSDGVVIGLAQVLALIPGTSRAGITMTAARMMGLGHRAAARFSMILSIPVILGSGVLKGADMIASNDYNDLWLGTLGLEMLGAAGLAMLVALLAISIMMAIIQRVGFMPFVVYRIILGCVILAVVYSLYPSSL